MTAEEAIKEAKSLTKHSRMLAPDTPIERFIAQAILGARMEAFETAGWSHAAKVCQEQMRIVGDTEIEVEA